MGDIDLVLPQGAIPTALKALAAEGWYEYAAGSGYDVHLAHPRLPGLPLELHWDVATRWDRANALRGDVLWRARVPLQCFGTAVFGLPPEEELVALAAHAGKPFHSFVQLIWSVDLAVVVATAGRSINWERVGQLADTYRCRTVVGVGLAHARRLGTQVPEDLVVVPVAGARGAVVAGLLDERWPLTTLDLHLARRLRYALTDVWWQRVGLFWGEISRDGLRRVPRQLPRMSWIAARRYWRLRVEQRRERLTG